MSSRYLLSLLALAACGAPSTTATVANQTAPAAVDYLVWTRGADGPATTVWVDADGNVRGRAQGILAAADGGLWRVTERSAAFPLRTCDELDRTPNAPPTGAGETASGQSLRLERLGGGGALDLGTLADEGYASLQWSTWVAGGIGPYLVVETSADEYACGAHGGIDASAVTVDLRTGAAREAPLATAAEAAADAPSAEELADLDPMEPDAAPHLALTVPVWRDGVLGARHLLWVDACYACGNGLWSSYTSAVWVDARELPAALAVLPPVPAAVARLAATRSEEEAAGISWGVPDETWRSAF